MNKANLAKLPQAEGADYFIVLDPKEGIVHHTYTADLGRSFGHDHIKDAQLDGVASAARWVVRPLFTAEPDLLTDRDEAEEFADKILDLVLGTDRHEWTSRYGRDDALAEVEDKVASFAAGAMPAKAIEALEMLESGALNVAANAKNRGDGYDEGYANAMAKMARETLDSLAATPAAEAPVAHPHHCTARSADGACDECEGHAQAMREWREEREAAAPVVQAQPDAWRDGARFALEAVAKVDSICWLTDSMKVICIRQAADAVIAERDRLHPPLTTASGLHEQAAEKSDTHGMNLGQRILHVGGRENDQTYIEFGSVAAVRALVNQVLRDLPYGAPGFAMPAAWAESAYQRGYRHGYDRRTIEVQGALL